MMHNQRGVYQAIIAVMELCAGQLTYDLAQKSGSGYKFSV